MNTPEDFEGDTQLTGLVLLIVGLLSLGLFLGKIYQEGHAEKENPDEEVSQYAMQR